MSNDLEDFLRRAAQRRAQKSASQPAPAPSKPRSEYTDRNAERRIRNIEVEVVDEPLTAIVVEPEEDSLDARRRKIEAARVAAAQAEAEAAERLAKIRATNPTANAPVPVATGNPVEDLLNLIRTPGGIQKAVLLREIIDRPEHRW